MSTHVRSSINNMFQRYKSICFIPIEPLAILMFVIGGFVSFVVLCPGAPEGSTGSGSGFEASQKTGPRFKVSFYRLRELRIEFWTTMYKANGLFITSRRPLASNNFKDSK